MPDKPRKLPPPPEGQNAFATALTGLRDLLGMGPVAYSRISRTPIYTESLPETVGGRYNPITQAITMRREDLKDGDFGAAIPHESAHAIYDRAGLDPSTLRTNEMRTTALMKILNHPELYGSSPDAKTVSNEGLAYSLGTPQGEPYVLQIAKQIKDPAVAQQLLRLHYNTLAVNQRFSR